MDNPISKLDLVVNGVTTSYDIHDANAIPVSGGAVITGTSFSRINNSGALEYNGGTSWDNGASFILRGKNTDITGQEGWVILHPSLGTTGNIHTLICYPTGTLTWDGTAIQYVSDQRYKQQIDQIDDKLLDAWEDVELVQFKYNESVDTKGKSARLHTGYVVQQIDNACKKHGVDVSEYGLYCHEQYPQETEEIEVEQADGTKTKERKVIREASEHYSLRYTEALIVECKYLRRCIERLTARIEQLEKEQEASK